MLEEAFQRLADRIALRGGQQMLQLLCEGPSLDLDARGEDLCHPLQGGERGGAARGVGSVRVCRARVEREETIEQTGSPPRVKRPVLKPGCRAGDAGAGERNRVWSVGWGQGCMCPPGPCMQPKPLTHPELRLLVLQLNTSDKGDLGAWSLSLIEIQILMC